MNRGERQPVASHGEILQEKLAPYMLSRVLLLSALFGCIEHSAANFFNLSRASVSPPMRVEPTAGFESYMIRKLNVEIRMQCKKEYKNAEENGSSGMVYRMPSALTEIIPIIQKN